MLVSNDTNIKSRVDCLGAVAKDAKVGRATVAKVNKILEKAPEKIQQECPCKSQKELAEKLQLNYNTVGQWTRQAKRLSPKIKDELTMCAHGFTAFHAHWLLKYPHNTQDKLAQTSIDKSLVIRLIENIHRSDLSDAEKGDGFLALWRSPECPFEELKQLAEKLQINYDTIKAHWIPASKKLSPKIRGIFGSSDVATFTNAHVHQLLKYPHSTQDKLAQTSIDKSLVS